MSAESAPISTATASNEVVYVFKFLYCIFIADCVYSVSTLIQNASNGVVYVFKILAVIFITHHLYSVSTSIQTALNEITYAFRSLYIILITDHLYSMSSKSGPAPVQTLSNEAVYVSKYLCYIDI